MLRKTNQLKQRKYAVYQDTGMCGKEKINLLPKKTATTMVCGTGTRLRNRDEHLSKRTPRREAKAQCNRRGESSWKDGPNYSLEISNKEQRLY